MSISKHISNKEGVYSRTALRLGIENKPNKEQLANMKLLAEEVFEPLRAYVGGPIKIIQTGYMLAMCLKTKIEIDV